MKRFLLFAVVVALFTACTQEIMVDVTNPTIADDAPETLVVGFEGDDTRIQLQGGKTVWTQGDQVSVFYKSDANQKWQYNGETGSRTAELKRVDAGVASARMDRVVVAYPYSDNYLLNLTTGDIEATMPAVQTYMKDSYGLDGNIMVASSYFTQFNLKNVCGWLKLQLTGDGEVVKSIKLRGNNGEQVAGLIYVDTENATSILASEMGDVTEDEGENITGGAGGNLVFDDTILTEVTLNCGEGVTLGKSATAFYIALPPQTFENGFTIEVECDGYKPMIISTSNSITIERNHIQPMAPKEHNAIPVVPNNQIWYTSSDGNVVTPYYTDVFGANIISNTYDNGKGVIIFDGDIMTIGDWAFEYCTSLTSVNIPESVKTIGYGAFSCCDNLTSVNIPESVTTIGEYAFEDCESLTSVNIPDNVTTIGDAAFAGCSNLREFTGKYAADGGRCLIIDNTIIAYANASGTTYNIPDSVTTIENSAFSWCDSLTSVNIPDSVTTIGEDAFSNCDSLTSVNIPDSVTEIGESAFSSCYRLTSVNISDSVTEIGESVFSNCANLTSVNIPDSVTTIGEYAFYDCDSLTSVNIPDSVKTIGYSAFEDCDSLTSVTIGNSVTTIDERAFTGCSKLREFTGKYAADGGRCLIIDNTIIAYAEASGTTYNIPESVTTIGEWAFSDCGNLTSVNIPDSVTSIGGFAFQYCDRLTSVYCKATTPPALGYEAFYNNASGPRIYVYEECVELYKSAWSSYKDSIYTNGQNCPDTTTIQYTTNDGNTITSSKLPIISNIYENGVGTMIIAGKNIPIPDSAFLWCDSLTSVNIPDSVTTIGIYAFYRCNSLISVNIPDSVTTIGDWAFEYCTSLTSVNIPESVKTIGYGAFSCCDNLTSVNIPNSVTIIGDWAFQHCYSLTSVNIGDSVTTIGDCAFGYCKSLNEFTGKYAADGGRCLIIDNTIIAYANASGTTYNIPDSVTTIENSAFSDCDSLTSVNIPDSVTSIGNSAFSDCDSLTSVNIPDSVTSIGNYAFSECGGLKYVYCKATTPPALGGSDVFYNSSSRRIIVPIGSGEAYRKATYWSEYANDIFEDEF